MAARNVRVEWMDMWCAGLKAAGNNEARVTGKA
jgi:hypothetical protein